MACITRFQSFPGKLCYHLCLLRHVSVAKHYISYREVHLSTCGMKSSSKEPNNKNLENDIDFFGINEPNEQELNEKNITRLSSSDKRYLQQLIENHSTQSRPPNVQLKSYGTVRYDHKIPKNENASERPLVHTTTTSRQRRKEKRLMRNAPNNKSDAQESTILLTEGGNEVHQISNFNTNCSRPDNDSKTGLAFVNEQYFSYSKASKGEIRNEKIVLSKQQMSFIDSQYFDGDSNNVKVERGNAFNFDSSNDTPSIDTTSNESAIYFDKGPDESFIDKQYFTYDGTCNENRNETQNDVHERNANIKAKTKKCSDERLTEVDDRKEPAVFKRVDTTRKIKTKNLTTEQDLAFIDAQYFSYDGEPISIQNKISEQEKEHIGLQRSDHSATDGVQRKTFDLGKFSVKSDKSESIARDFEEYDTKDTNDGKLRKQNDPMMNSKMGQRRKPVVDSPLVNKKQMAYDLSMKIRAEFEHKSGSNLTGKFDPKEYDSKGFRILSNQVPHFEYAPSIDILKVLRNSIIYDQNDVLAISKPYGLPSQGGPGVLHSVGSLLDQIIPKTQLHPIHRLDKETTGVMLFAKTEEMAERLSECFLKRIITKKYLVITKNIPQMKSGEIDIPVDEGTVEGKVRMCLRPYSSPQLSAVMKKRQPGMEAITRYRVLDQGKKCSLIECFPVTGKKHQIRVHLAFGLNCPVLGDHKYSHINKIAPMRLHPEILEKLNIQQSKVRYLAMHLHARSIMIPEFLSGRNLFISAPLPPHFVRNLKDLRLNLPPHI